MNYGTNAERLGIEKLADVHGLEKEAVIAAMRRGGRALLKSMRGAKSAPGAGSITQHNWSKAIQAHPSRVGRRPNLSKTVNVTAPPMRPTLMQHAAPVVSA